VEILFQVVVAQHITVKVRGSGIGHWRWKPSKTSIPYSVHKGGMRDAVLFGAV